MSAEDETSAPERSLKRRAGQEAKGSIVSDIETQKLIRENDYLKLRCAQLQGDVTDLGSQLLRLQQELERLHGARTARRGEPHGVQ